MAAFDPSPLPASAAATPASLAALACRAAQSLVNALWSLPSEAAPVGRVAELPRPSTPLPRQKPPPAPRPPTRWEAFAAQKGIVKKKRSKLVFDEDANEWRRRHGKGRVGDDADVHVVDAKPGDVLGTDPFAEAAAARRDKRATNKRQQLGNLKKAAGKKGGGALALPPTLRLAAALPSHGKGKPVRSADARPALRAASKAAGVSTASLGKHDALASGETRADRARALAGPRRKFEPVVGGSDAARTANIVDRVIRSNADDVIDTGRAVARLEGERRKEVAAVRAAGGGADDDWRARGRAKSAGGGARRSKFGRPVAKGWTKADSKAKTAAKSAAGPDGKRGGKKAARPPAPGGKKGAPARGRGKK
jgi:regulator of ribosome biosynthesis